MSKHARTIHGRLGELLGAESLSPAHRRVGQWILDHPRDSMFMTSVDLARAAQVSQASVIRFAAAVGFDGYLDLQRRIREVVASVPADELLPLAGNRYQRAAADGQRQLDGLVESLADEEHLLQLGVALAEARGLVVVGLRHSGGLANYFGYLAAKIHPNVRMVSSGGAMAQEQFLHASGDGAEWVVCFALPRYPTELIELLATAQSLGLKVLTVTDRQSLALTELSDVLLSAPTAGALAFDVPTGPVLYAGILLDAMREASPRRSQDRLDAEEALALKLGTYASPG